MKTCLVDIFVNKWMDDATDKNKIVNKLVRAASYSSSGGTYEEILERAFKIFNAPEECLSEDEILVLKDYHRNFPSLSVGDFVKLTEIYEGVKNFECKNCGWAEVEKIPEI